MEKRDSIVLKFRENKGLNCAQAVLMAFCDETGMDADTAAKVASGLGGGVAGSGNVCGAVTGMLIAAGLLLAHGADISPEEKTEYGKVSKALTARFSEEFGSLLCSELKPKPEETDKPSCNELCRRAAEILDEYLANQGK